MLKRAWLEEKLGQYPHALRWVARVCKAVDGLPGPEAARQAAQVSAYYATILQVGGRSKEALRWARLAVTEAEAIGDDDALGAAYFVMGWVCGATSPRRAWNPCGSVRWKPTRNRAIRSGTPGC